MRRHAARDSQIAEFTMKVLQHLQYTDTRVEMPSYLRLTAAKSSRMTSNPLRRARRQKLETEKILPSTKASKKHAEEQKKVREDKSKQKQEKLQVVPGPIHLDWELDPTEGLLRAIDIVLESMWDDIPEKGLGYDLKCELHSFRKGLPPLVMGTHLHAIFLNDSTYVEREMRRRCRAHKIRRLLVNVVEGGEMIIRAQDYYNILDEHASRTAGAVNQAYQEFKALLKEQPEAVSISPYDLEAFPSLEANRSVVLNAGFLTLQPGSDTLNISVPNIGVYLRLVTSSRKWVTRGLSKMAWKEILESQLNDRWESQKSYWREFKGARLQWVLTDCYGGGWCEPFNTPVGRGWKVTGKR
ncbi:hypothetical protein TRVA0_052S00716 [Trichomonascus vanleenenianus]|uniref:Stk19 family serine/threonine-protein kinase n=1 Tax=Trichomonascus vanleenenianus TaxID=2268995 RepID=UPI003ECBA6E2